MYGTVSFETTQVGVSASFMSHSTSFHAPCSAWQPSVRTASRARPSSGPTESACRFTESRRDGMETCRCASPTRSSGTDSSSRADARSFLMRLTRWCRSGRNRSSASGHQSERCHPATRTGSSSTRAGSRTSFPCWSDMRPRDGPALQGGLPLPRGLYLRGGEPDVWIPPAGGEERQVRLGSTTWTIGPEGGSVSLRQLALTEGRYEIEIPPSRLSFVTMESCGAVRAPDTGTLAFRLHMDDRGEWVGAKPGEVLLPTEPRKPAWMRRVNMQPRSFEVDPPFDVVWVLAQWPHRGWVARARSSTPPSQVTNGHEGEDLANWIAVFKSLDPRLEGEEAALWAMYQRAASEIPGT